VTYGKSTPTSYTDPEVIRIYKVLNHFELAMRPGAYLVDRVPLLRYLPGYGQQLTEWHNEELSLYRHQLERVKSEMVSSFSFDEHDSFMFSLCLGTKQSEFLLHQDTVGAYQRSPTCDR
jgi:hypothetical protein